jgi:hypothetical protein
MPVIVEGSQIYNLSGNVMLRIQHREAIAATTAKLPRLPPLPSVTMKSSKFVEPLPPLEQYGHGIGGEEFKEASQVIFAGDSDQKRADMGRTRQINDAIEVGLRDLGMSIGS